MAPGRHLARHPRGRARLDRRRLDRAHNRSPWSGDLYGYGWFLSDIAGRPIAYARGYGGQMLFVDGRRSV